MNIQDSEFKRIGFVELPDEALDLLSFYTQNSNSEVLLVVSLNPDSYAVRMADILSVPTLEFPDRVSLMSCDIIIVGPHPADQEDQIREMMEGTEATVMSLDEALAQTALIKKNSGEFLIPEEVLDSLTDPEEDRPNLGPDTPLTQPGESNPGDTGPSATAPKPPVAKAPVAKASEGFDAASILGADFQTEIGALSLDTTQDDLLNRILDIAIRATHTQTGSIMLVDEGGSHLRIAVAKGLPSDVVANVRQRIGEGVSGQVFESGNPRILRGRVPRRKEIEKGLRPSLREAAVVPILSNGRSIGVLSVNSESAQCSLSDDSLQLLERFAKEVSTAVLKAINLGSLEGSRRFEALMRQVEQLMALDDGLTARLKAVSQALGSAFNCDLADLYLVDPLGVRLERAGSHGTLGLSSSQNIDKGMLGWVLRDGQVRVLETWSRDGSEGVATFFLPIRGDWDHGLFVLENATLQSPGVEDYVVLFQDVLERLAEMIEVEKSLEAQELFSQLQLRISEQSRQFNGLLPRERARAILDFVTGLLSAETAVWVRDDASLWARPSGPRTVALQTKLRPHMASLTEWVVGKEEGAGGLDLPGWDSDAPDVGAPFAASTVDGAGGCFMVFFSAEKSSEALGQMTPEIVIQVLRQLAKHFPEELQSGRAA